ncbi:hypothetical protein WN51_02971 [Melipona quadrifasciata]|uniref:Uncharacterized protein n=1 Tax=Melipona quadrifasciata TaxID=166423 RepID=A0A0M8ZX23_9HYME|nr:hypothetical protein WN51_02971 [Melipona quadrifasciata]
MLLEPPPRDPLSVPDSIAPDICEFTGSPCPPCSTLFISGEPPANHRPITMKRIRKRQTKPRKTKKVGPGGSRE